MNDAALYATSNLRCLFQSDLGNEKVKSGTAFWATNYKGDLFMVTCRHTVYEEDLPERQGVWSLHQVQARGFFAQQGRTRREVSYTITFSPDGVQRSQTADIACWSVDAMVDGSMDIGGWAVRGELRPNTVGHHEFATADEFDSDIRVCDQVFITGFPALKADRQLERPVAIGGWLASDPRYDYEHTPAFH